MDPYNVLICIDILRLEKPSRRDRELILSFLERLATNPEENGDYQEKDEVERLVQIKVIGKHALTFWADHAVKEVKITKIELADRP